MYAIFLGSPARYSLLRLLPQDQGTLRSQLRKSARFAALFACFDLDLVPLQSRALRLPVKARQIA